MSSRVLAIGSGILAALVLLLLSAPSVAAGPSLERPALGLHIDPGSSSGTAYQASCPRPRPPVKLNVQPEGDGQIKVTITAGFGTLYLVLFGAMQNGHAVIPGTNQIIPSNREVPVPPGLVSWTFAVVSDQGVQTGAPPPSVTIPLTVFDGCGLEHPWRTFVGGGPAALIAGVEIADAQITEGNSGTTTATLPVRLTLPSKNPVTVTYTVGNGSATAPADFRAASGLITFAPGETQQAIQVQTNGDFDAEADETLTVTLSNPSNAVLRRGVATVKIVNDDTAPSAGGDAYQATAGQTLSVGAGSGPPPGLLVNDQSGTQSTQIVSFGGLNAGGDVTTFPAGSTATLPGGGSLLVRADGSFNFTSAPSFVGSFSFRYRAKSLAGQSDATVIITVLAVPVANDDPSLVVVPPAGLSVAAPGLLGNDSVGTPPGAIVQFGGLDAGGALGTASATQAGTVRDLGNGGILKVNGDGSFQFAAPSTASGPFRFQYRLQNSVGFDDATATIDVRRGPVVVTTSGTTAFTEGSGPVVVDAGLTVTHPSGINLTSATVTIANLVDAGQETLSANAGTTGIALSYTAPTLTLTGDKPAADYQQVLRTITYNNTSAAPSSAARTIQFQAASGAQTSSPATKSVAIGPVNDAPVLANIESSPVAYTENAAPTGITTQILVTDIDSPNLSSAVVQIATGCVPTEDILALSPPPPSGISTDYDSSSCRLSLSGSASLSSYQAALRAVLYSNSSDTPTTAPRTARFRVSDGAAVSNVVDRAIAVSSVDDAPVAVADTATVAEDSPATAIPVLVNDTDVDGGPKLITATTDPAHGTVVVAVGGTSLTYRPDANYCNQPGGTADTFNYTITGGSTATVSVTVTCVDDPPVAVDDTATVAENSPATAIPVLANDTDVDGGPKLITATTDPAHGTVVVAVGGTSLTYRPDASYCNQPGGTPDTFNYTITGGSTATVSVAVTCVDDPPVVTTTGGSPTFYERGDPVVVDSGVTVTDADSATLAWATIRITNVKNGNAETLDVNLSGLTGISKSTSRGDGTFTLTLTGPASLATFQTALQRVTYYNNSHDLNLDNRIIRFQVNDGTFDSNLADKIVLVRDAP